jgi:ferredoxin
VAAHASGGEPPEGDQRQPGENGIGIELRTQLCRAHGICMELAPAYFTPDEDGYVSLTPGAQQRGDSPQLQLAAASCPMKVITVTPPHPTSSRTGTDSEQP